VGHLESPKQDYMRANHPPELGKRFKKIFPFNQKGSFSPIGKTPNTQSLKSLQVDKFFPNGSLAASPLHPHPSLVLILSHTRWTARITQP